MIINLNHMKKIISTFVILTLFFFYAAAQETSVKIYNPLADAKADLAKAIRTADSLNKNVLVQVGGNWCPWCIKFHKFCKNDTIIDTLMNKNYVVVHLSYGKGTEPKNLDILKDLDFPQRFGFPVFVILNKKGKRIHTQDSSFLESGEGYDQKKIISFLKQWTVSALDPEKYNKK